MDKIIPWMETWEIEVVKMVLMNLHPSRCLEWGAGYSSIYFSKFLPKNSIWYSVEHDLRWARKIQFKLWLRIPFRDGTKIKIFHVPPNDPAFIKRYGEEGEYSDLNDYVDFPKKLGYFDFIFIDGRARKDCLIRAYEVIKDRGVVVLHDANRRYYHEPFSLYGHQVFLPGHQEDAGGLWLGSKFLDVKSLLSRLPDNPKMANSSFKRN